ncbi:hypothetical protein ASF59_09730 [Methylobacterium sp. Leaf121]|nr:hypothetical protein ASF59_09730 [Methylobacterium sp. Leaf121]
MDTLLPPALVPGGGMVAGMVIAVQKFSDGGPVATAHHRIDLREAAALEDGSETAPRLRPLWAEHDSREFGLVGIQAGWLLGRSRGAGATHRDLVRWWWMRLE